MRRGWHVAADRVWVFGGRGDHCVAICEGARASRTGRVLRLSVIRVMGAGRFSIRKVQALRPAGAARERLPTPLAGSTIVPDDRGWATVAPGCTRHESLPSTS